MTAARELGSGILEWSLGAFPERAAFSADSAEMAFALGDGRIAVMGVEGQDARFFAPHEGGSCMSLAAHPKGGWLSGGDDGRLVYTSPEGECTMVHEVPGHWLEVMAASQDGGTLAVAAGRTVLVFDLSLGSMTEYGPHQGNVSGLAFSPAGGILAATHVGGVSLWDLDEPSEPIFLELRGLNLAPAFSPDGNFLACGHQENAIHVVDLASRKVFQLGGLPAKPGQLAWSLDGRYLMHTGTRAVVCWPVPDCFNQHPEPVAFAVQEEARMTALAANTRIPFAAAGFGDGTVLLAELKRFTAFPLGLDPGFPVSCLCWSGAGLHLACGMEDGRAALLDLGKMLSEG
ncbi:WD40 repeat domain-containing protein [Fundidesulfovibrio soli]|uniref:WD40 repeat domain-containing protein n=1 Tax=Fundidesulfovibrio soli TaxID=2922716 RepID=UPI001FAF1E79|nr:hypothetical protein [Fundidesulfovibrio soli]